LGGEEKAGVGPQVADGAVGAARAVQQALGDAGTVVATVICGDNYAAEQAERAVAEMVPLVAAARPDLVVAGPAFLAGRYGFARGLTRNVVAGAVAADRAVAMLLDKLAARPFASEVPRPAFPHVPAPRLIKTLEGATIALVTDGGLVPRGNPDGIEALNATRY